MSKFGSIFTVIFTIAASFMIVSECHKLKNGRNPDTPFKCTSLVMYRMNYCKYCRCVLEVLLCGPDIECSGQKYWQARYCQQKKSWKEDCNTCECTVYGTACTVNECPPDPETTTDIDTTTDVDATEATDGTSWSRDTDTDTTGSTLPTETTSKNWRG